MQIKVKDKTVDIENFSFSDTTCWLYFDSEKYNYETLKEVFEDLDVDTMLEIFEEDFIKEAHSGYNYLSTVMINNRTKQFEFALTKSPVEDRLKSLEETVDILLMSQL